MVFALTYHPEMSAYRPERTEEVLQQDAITLTSDSAGFYRKLALTLLVWDQQSNLLRSREIVSRLNDALLALSDLQDDWDSYGSPAPAGPAISEARNAVQFLWSRNLLPEKAAPSAEGGVVLYFSSGPRKAFLEFLNEGEVVLAHYSKDKNDEPIVKTLRNGVANLDDNSVADIRRHLLPDVAGSA